MFLVCLLSHNGNKKAEVVIPFAPTPGVFFMAPWRNYDYYQATDVYFNHKRGHFEVFLDDNDCQGETHEPRTPTR